MPIGAERSRRRSLHWHLICTPAAALHFRSKLPNALSLRQLYRERIDVLKTPHEGRSGLQAKAAHIGGALDVESLYIWRRSQRNDRRKPPHKQCVTDLASFLHDIAQNAKKAFGGIHRMNRHSGFSRLIGRAVIAGGALLACMHAAQAAPIAPLPGFEPDEGTSFFLPGDSVVGIELVDAFEPFTSFGFYYTSASSTLVTVMETTDTTGTQIAFIDFLNGVVLDVDASTPQNTFTPQDDAIGFFLTVAATTYFSDPALNPFPVPLDTFSAFESSGNPAIWAVAFDLPTRGLVYAAQFTGVSPVSAVPEPSVLLLLFSAFPALVIIGLRRRFASLTA